MQKYIQLSSYALASQGLVPVSIEVVINPGMPVFNVIGISPGQGRNIREKVRATLRTLGLALPLVRVTVSVYSEYSLEHTTSLELPIAVALWYLVQNKKLPSSSPALLGSLHLNGSVYLEPAFEQALGQLTTSKKVVLPKVRGSLKLGKQVSALSEALGYLEKPSDPVISSSGELIEVPVGLFRALQIAYLAKQPILIIDLPFPQRSVLKQLVQALADQPTIELSQFGAVTTLVKSVRSAGSHETLLLSQLSSVGTSFQHALHERLSTDSPWVIGLESSCSCLRLHNTCRCTNGELQVHRKKLNTYKGHYALKYVYEDDQTKTVSTDQLQKKMKKLKGELVGDSSIAQVIAAIDAVKCGRQQEDEALFYRVDGPGK